MYGGKQRVFAPQNVSAWAVSILGCIRKEKQQSKASTVQAGAKQDFRVKSKKYRKQMRFPRNCLRFTHIAKYVQETEENP